MLPEPQPFAPVAQTLRELRNLFVEELASEEHTEYSSSLLGTLLALIRNCEVANIKIADLSRRDNLGYLALCRAMTRMGMAVAAEEMEANEEVQP